MPLIMPRQYNNTLPRLPAALLLHMDGANNSTNFVDVYGHTFTQSTSGVAVIKTGAQKMGTACGYFNGTGCITTPSFSEITLGAEDFTIDFWINPSTVTPSYQEFLTKGSGIQFYLQGSTLMIALSASNSTTYFVISSVGTLAINNWYHVALVKLGNVYSAYLNGVRSFNISSALNISDGGMQWVIGAYNPSITAGGAINYPYTGYLDELRILKGTAAFVGPSFTVPTTPYTE